MKTIKRPNYVKLSSMIPLIAVLILVFSCENNVSSVTDENLAIAVEPESTDLINVVEENKTQPIDINQGDTIYKAVDTPPKPVGGLDEFYKNIATNMTYPADAKENGIQGKVFVEFVVLKDGSISNIKVIRGIGESCDKEAERVIRENSTKWIPGEHRGTKLNVRLVIPIQFKLD